MEFAVATEEHLDALCAIGEQAKRQMRADGIDQWQKGYPARETWADDIACGCAHVALGRGGAVCGVFAFKEGADPSYAHIDGAWLTAGDARYAALHRVCVADSCKGRGVAGALFAHAFDLARARGLGSIRIDTHPDNAPMQRALEKAGFALCGTIRLAEGVEAGEPRLAYEKEV